MAGACFMLDKCTSYNSQAQSAWHALLQELDEAARRRMPKQVFVPLPCPAARRQMLTLIGQCVTLVHQHQHAHSLQMLVSATLHCW